MGTCSHDMPMKTQNGRASSSEKLAIWCEVTREKSLMTMLLVGRLRICLIGAVLPPWVGEVSQR